VVVYGYYTYPHLFHNLDEFIHSRESYPQATKLSKLSTELSTAVNANHSHYHNANSNANNSHLRLQIRMRAICIYPRGA